MIYSLDLQLSYGGYERNLMKYFLKKSLGRRVFSEKVSLNMERILSPLWARLAVAVGSFSDCGIRGFDIAVYTLDFHEDNVQGPGWPHFSCFRVQSDCLLLLFPCLVCQWLLSAMKVVPEKNAVRILWGRERGTQAFGAQRLLQELVEDKTRWMKWEGKVRKMGWRL